MGVDFYPCEECGETFPDCGDYCSCEMCSVMLCTPCANEKGLSSQITDLNQCDEAEKAEAVGEGYCQCPYCTGESVTEELLMKFAMEKLGVDREGLAAMYRESQSR